MMSRHSDTEMALYASIRNRGENEGETKSPQRCAGQTD